jgi:hypothetical protein
MQATRNEVPAAVPDLTPINRPTVTLTPRGHAVRAVYRLTCALARLDPADRAAVVALLAAELGAVAPIA